MSYRFIELKNAPAFLKELGLRAVYVPNQDGWREHYALMDTKSTENYFLVTIFKGWLKKLEIGKNWLG